MTTHDAVVIGAGPNGLVAANRLVDAGWDVVVLEAQSTPGGAVRSDRELLPDFVQDTFSAFYPLALASAPIRSLRLEEHGLAWTHAPAVLGHPRTDGSWALLSRDVEITAGVMEGQHAGDGDAWRELHDLWQRMGPGLTAALMSPMPPVRAGAGLLARLPSAGGLSFVRLLLEPATTLVRQRFGGDSPKLLLCGNAAHADIPLDAPGSGLMGLLITMLGQTVGFPVPVGGAGELIDAMVRRLESKGGTLHTDAKATSVVVENGRAVAVRTDGEEFRARRAVVADVAAPQLYGNLVAWNQLPDRTRRDMAMFELDPGTVKVDWALSGPVPWSSPPEHQPGTVHVAESLDGLTTALNQVTAQHIPADPFLLTGQMTTSDPSRSPAGTESFWAYTHVPQHARADARGELTGAWDRDECERFADRMQQQIERFAPDFSSVVLARRVLGPKEMEQRDGNLIGGAINGGTASLHQQLVFRPVTGLGRANTPVKGLYLGSASAHPGGGVHGACGMNAARAALADARWEGLKPWV
jgi:phytoene dehydrogenase-like protein